MTPAPAATKFRRTWKSVARAQVLDRLITGFPDVPADTVHEIVGAVRQRFDSAKIRDFVPLFVERHTKEKLANLAGTAPHPV